MAAEGRAEGDPAGGQRGSEPPDLVERSMALVCRNLFNETNALLSVGRFQLLRTLGRGGTGIVYEAYDPELSERIALKMLHRRGPTQLYLLKREFRSLSELSHPNLVALRELSATERDPYFTMDLIPGRDFVSYVRDGTSPGEPPRDPARLRAALGQLCDAVHALHSAGKLHRDLKPSNVLVTESGRVVVLDFGLVHEVDDAGSSIAGTPAYMAPEQRRGEVSEASDWYAFGRVLEESLRGALSWPPWKEPSAHGGDGELELLLRSLLQADPALRPGYVEITAILRGTEAQRAGRRERVTRLVGREREFGELSDAFARSRMRPVVVLLRGDAGMGKSALVQHFIQSALIPARALVLSGRCYERESVSYKALDSVIDELSRCLLSLPATQVAGLRPDDCAALLHMFPVLGRVPALQSDRISIDSVHPVELRKRGFIALRHVLRRMSAHRPLAISIEDLQWSDADSGQLLSALLCGEDSPPLLVIASERGEPGTFGPAIEQFRVAAELSLRPPPIVELTLRPLTANEARELAAQLLPAGADGKNDLRERVALEARGNPRLLVELSHWIPTHRDQLDPGWAHPSLTALLNDRLSALSAGSRLALELLATAGRPVPRAVLAGAAAITDNSHAVLKELRAARLVRAPRQDDEALELEHDHIAEAVLERLEPAQRHALHAALMRAYDAAEGFASDALIDQYIGAGQPVEAARRARVAADVALKTLAFARAARLYEQALRLGEWSPSEEGALSHDLGLALEHAGQGLESASAYQRAAALESDALRAVQIEQRAARQLMHQGRHTEGELLYRHGYERLGLAWPKGRFTLLLAIARLLLPAWLRRLRLFGPKVSLGLRRARAEFLSGVGRGFDGYDILRSLHNALLCFNESEQLPDRVWRARALAARGLARCGFLGPRAAQRGLEQLERASAEAEALGDVHALGDIQSQRSLALFLVGRPELAIEQANRAERNLRAILRPPIDLYTAMAIIGFSLLELGRLREAQRRWSAFALDARLHGDLMTTFWIQAHPVQFAVLFANEDREGAQAIIAQQLRLRTLHPDFLLLVWTQATCLIEYELFWGDPMNALRLIERDRRALFGSGYPFLTENARLRRARAYLNAAAALAPGRERSRLLRRAARDARALEHGSQDGRRGWILVAQAAIEHLRNRPARALAKLDAALPFLEATPSKLDLATVRYCQGALAGGAANRTQQQRALNTLREEGVVAPERWIAWTASGFRGIVRRDK